MSWITQDYQCKECDLEFVDVMHQRGEKPDCEGCEGELVWLPSPTINQEWPQSRYITSLDREFSSRSELNSYLKAHGLKQAQSAEKHHGARNESHLGLGRIYSYAN